MPRNTGPEQRKPILKRMRKDVRKALRGRSLSFLGANREIRKLDNYLHEGEEVHDLMACKFGDTGGRALIAITDERVLVFKDGWIFKNSQGMSYRDIRSIKVSTGLFFATITFKGEGMNFVASKVGRWAAEHGTKIVRSRIGSRYNTWQAQLERDKAEQAKAPEQPLPQTDVTASMEASKPFYDTDQPLGLEHFLPQVKAEPATETKTSGLADELERLRHLKDAGFLTDEEFSEAKRRLLS